MQNLHEHLIPQSQPLSNRQALNNAGGYAFPVDDWTRLDRFLVLGTEGGTYYQNEQTLTIENANGVLRAIEEDGLRVVARIVEISHSGRAPKNDPALFALAMCTASKDVKVRKAAFDALPKVARIGTHLFHFVKYAEFFRGWGPMMRRGVRDWYQNKPLKDLVLQAVKYQQRDGWSHRDLLRLSRPYAGDDRERKILYDWICRKAIGVSTIKAALELEDDAEAVAKIRDASIMEQYPALAQIAAMEELHQYEGRTDVEKDVSHAISLIQQTRLPREALPTELLNVANVWSALLPDMPLGALVRNLGKMTAVGVLKRSNSAEVKTVLEKLGSGEQIRRSRLHPLAILVAQKVYESGQGFRGKLTWSPLRVIVDALDNAFYESFGNVKPTGKRLLVALDVSSSMDGGTVAGSMLTPKECSGALALVTAKTEQNAHFCAFSAAGEQAWKAEQARYSSGGISPVNIRASMKLPKVLQVMNSLPFGGTDCSLPMRYALDRGLQVDAFIILTDSETWAGSIHPMAALRQYRAKTGIPAKLVVVGMTSSGFSIADPEDGGCMDVVGFDTAVPNLMSDFIRGPEQAMLEQGDLNQVNED